MDSNQELKQSTDNAIDTCHFLLEKRHLQEINAASVLSVEQRHQISVGQDVRLFRLTRLVSESREAMLDNAMNVYLSAGARGHKVFFVIKADGKTAELFIGVGSTPGEMKAKQAGNLLEESFNGHFPGSELNLLKSEAAEDLLTLNGQFKNTNAHAVTALSGVSSLSVEQREHFVQGLERFLDASSNRTFTALILANPISNSKVDDMALAYEQMATELSAMNKQQISYGFQESDAVSDALSSSLSQAIGASLSHTTTEGTSSSKTHTESESDSVNISSRTTQNILKKAGKALKSAFLGGETQQSVSQGKSTSKSESATEGVNQSMSDSASESKTDTVSDTQSKSFSKTQGQSLQQSIEIENKSVTSLLKSIDDQLERIQEAKSYGGWDVAAYFVSEFTETSESLASLFLGLTRGQASKVEPFAINTWNNRTEEKREQVLKSLRNLEHPQIEMPASLHPFNIKYATPAAFMSGAEMAVQLSLPRRSTTSVTVIDPAVFGRTITPISNKAKSNENSVHLGCIRHLWKDTESSVSFNMDNLCGHALITGTTGVGKTTTVMSVLAQVHKANIPFMVIEPAKGEYKQLTQLATEQQPVNYLLAGQQGSNTLKINPFVFPEGIALTDHIDRITTVFNAAFSMYGPMPQILEEAIFAAYESLGWDTFSSRCISVPKAYPTLMDVLAQLPIVVKALGYSEQVMGDFVGALSARLKSLTRGSLGATLVCEASDETSYKQLFQHSNVIDLSAMGAPDKRAIVMGMLFMRLYEHRLAEGLPDESSLRHFMVLEEAHVLLKKTPTGQTQESSNTTGLAVEAFASALAEMRAYGQGFMVADQSASAIDDSVLKNTNIKIVMRAPYQPDREALGGALALTDEQTNQLSMLENHTAVVHQSDWLEPVLCHISKTELPTKVENVPDKTVSNNNNVRQAKVVLLCSLWETRLKLVSNANTLLQGAITTLNVSISSEEQINTFLNAEKRFPDDFGLAADIVFTYILTKPIGASQMSLRGLSNFLLAQLQDVLTDMSTEKRNVIVKDLLRILRPDKKVEISELVNL